MYRAIGESIINNLKEYDISLRSDNPEQLYYILGKQLVKSFISDNKWDDISLARSYLKLI
jgi:hypothetical protein